MTVRTVILTIALLGLFACSSQPESRALTTSASNAKSWTITQDGIGDLKLGGNLTQPEGGLDDRYRASYYREQEPLEGFELDNPPVLAVLEDGPFRTWAKMHAGHEAPEAIRTRAVALARAKRFTIGMLVITDRRPKTAAGISVGDDYARFARAYPRAPAPDTFVGLWEQPSCMVNSGTIWFFFDRCDDADQAKIIRIAIRPERSRV
jgi:hypothetical protein